MTLKEFKADKQYLNENYESLKAAHGEEFVVIHEKRVVSFGTELDKVLSDARRKIGAEINDSVVEYLGTRKIEMVV